MKYEERNGKFYLILSDGEIELTKDEIQQRIEQTENLKRLSEISLAYSEGKKWAIPDLPIEFESVTQIDLFIENLTKVLQKLFDEGRNPTTLLAIIDILIQITTENIKNPLLKENKDINKYFKEKLKGIKRLFSDLPQQESKAFNTEPQKQKNGFSILEWATIFYYADETKLLTDDKTIKARIEKFMIKHNINTTFSTFKNNYTTAKKRINKDSSFPIQKLNLIIPFVKENYKQAVTKVENDIIFLNEESAGN